MRKIEKVEIVALLEQQFTHNDYLRLSRKWKLIRIDTTADVIMQMLEYQAARIEQLEKALAGRWGGGG